LAKGEKKLERLVHEGKGDSASAKELTKEVHSRDALAALGVLLLPLLLNLWRDAICFL
jgi:hypothetical protein